MCELMLAVIMPVVFKLLLLNGIENGHLDKGLWEKLLVLFVRRNARSIHPKGRVGYGSTP